MGEAKRRKFLVANHPEFAPLRGWMKRGMDKTQRFQGWEVRIQAEPSPGYDVPVSIIFGHEAAMENKHGN